MDGELVAVSDLVKTANGFRVAVTRRTNEPNRVTSPANGERIIKQLQNHNNVMRTDKLMGELDGSLTVTGIQKQPGRVLQASGMLRRLTVME